MRVPGVTSYSWKGTRMQSAHAIQKGLYVRKSTSVHRFPGLLASQRWAGLRPTLGPVGWQI